MNNIRFWEFVRDDWVKITLKPGQHLHHFTCYHNGEGWSREDHEWQYNIEDGQLLNIEATDGWDCDGRMSTYQEHVAEINANGLVTKPWAPSPNGLAPVWRKAGSSQRDYQAEAAGY